MRMIERCIRMLSWHNSYVPKAVLLPPAQCFHMACKLWCKRMISTVKYTDKCLHMNDIFYLFQIAFLISIPQTRLFQKTTSTQHQLGITCQSLCFRHVHVAFCSSDETNITIMDKTLELSVMEGSFLESETGMDPVLSSTPQKPRGVGLRVASRPTIRKCTWCNFTTRNSSTMTRHRRRQHTGMFGKTIIYRCTYICVSLARGSSENHIMLFICVKHVCLYRCSIRSISSKFIHFGTGEGGGAYTGGLCPGTSIGGPSYGNNPKGGL